MSQVSPDAELLERLSAVPELAASGFSVREGLTGAGVTVLKGRTYFGSWRVTAGVLCWIQANAGDEQFVAQSVDDAERHTMLMVLRSLESSRQIRLQRTAT
jgi:hypothetical protein